ncbi:acetyl-CoA decarbonylase/synthase complex subunit delta [Alkalibaculum sp. M08DMB]|uniref:Acetyl-CoA decarbonylase/synthase complex subunit delta n=1 Tax=Alkalibaculum sporogenes TaxID=2655001 RepID=A0A6A7KBH7_9FIRM|nr:acetyl-CoA decarbonylase/synthase complex subunit delta [Alkalibaculum sporogenes]MPW26621.1 acetyl-CoA decarbonylase/synthase complex subunit delta [Alkalibaculum sporogenes]
MAYKKVAKKYSGKIKEVTIGTGDKAITLGGRNVLPLHAFDGEVGQSPKVGLEIVDEVPSDWIDAFANLYGDVQKDAATWAKYVEETYAPDFICLRFEGADPNGSNRSVEECVETAKKVSESVSLPLVIAGSKNVEKDSEIFKAIAEALEGKNILLLSAQEENYKTVGAAGALAYKQKVAAESSVDINLAKQLNILMTQLGVQKEDVVMHVGCAAAGYGYEYVSSTMDRITLAALGQNDETLQMPIITPISFETWSVKESIATEEDEPNWGSIEERGIHMEVSTAAASIASGSDAVIVRHPKSLEAIKYYLNSIIG